MVAGGSGTAKEKDTRERRDGEHNRVPGESWEREWREGRRARFGTEEERSGSSQRRTSDGYHPAYGVKTRYALPPFRSALAYLRSFALPTLTGYSTVLSISPWRPSLWLCRCRLQPPRPNPASSPSPSFAIQLKRTRTAAVYPSLLSAIAVFPLSLGVVVSLRRCSATSSPPGNTACLLLLLIVESLKTPYLVVYSPGS